MSAAAKELGIPYRRFRQLVQNELTLWRAKPPTKNIDDGELVKLVRVSCEKKNKNVKEAYQEYLKLVETPQVNERGFKLLCSQLNIEFQRQSPKKFQANNYQEIFKLHETEMNSRTFRRSFTSLVLTTTEAETFLTLDPDLTKEHLQRYVTIKKNNCWTCGKFTHINLPVRLEIDHISGDSFDNRLSNLRFLCACCHKLTDNHSKNKTKLAAFSSNENPLYSYFEKEVDLDFMKRLFDQQTF